ncbi:glycosyltransferase family 2 protein [Candidatus Contubernalis alkaliaceticus]|uniref:glycosyltransferase family 2 protein n=1 Tax=Candidatus Contubernalis alkaliaceticus TaxID=338645 RepID=UPI001F4C0FC8|nr:glycosyltransferase family 2 protein [Candidatus Contubernalis alkalaceticus]UNC93638.1 glycosyltransferase family 2 protein [Candidatus Contubernalis alkalaceticus]
MSKVPKVTVLMSVYNGEEFLAEAVESILEQTFQDFQFLILNNGSTDKTPEIVDSYNDPRIRLVHNEKNLGLAGSLNRGLDLAEGEYVVRMDCDDISLPQRLDKQAAFMDSNPKVGVCGTWVETMGETPGEIKRFQQDPDLIKAGLLFGNFYITHPSVIMRSSLFKKHKLYYNPALYPAEDYALWQKCSKLFPLTNIPEVLLKYRILPTSGSHANQEHLWEVLRLIARESLLELGVYNGEEDLSMHMDFRSLKRPVSQEMLIKAEQWLQRIKTANQLKKIYPEKALMAVLEERWFYLCNTAAGLGPRVWHIYSKSPFSSTNHLPFSKKARFGLRCLLKKKTITGM